MTGLYIHIPFCHSKCSYCDFYSGLSRGLLKGYVDALIAELKLRRDEITEPLSTVYIGGGTPSIMPPADIVKLVNHVTDIAPLTEVAEFTIEVNPEDVTECLLDTYRKLGVNRISIGVQSFNDNLLKNINRCHSAKQAIDAVAILKKNGWKYSMDLMFGLPGQTLQMWSHDVDILMQLRPPHFSAYLLSYEPGTRMYAMLQSGKVQEASEESVSLMQSYINQSAKENGYSHYEISNYALSGFHSLHNSAYWTMTPYLGLGASAHSFDGSLRRFNPANLKRYLNAIQQGSIPAIIEEETTDERFNDYIITGLRTAPGLSISSLRNKFPEAYVEKLLQDAGPFLDNGQLVLSDDNFSIKEEFWLKSDTIMRELLRV